MPLTHTKKSEKTKARLRQAAITVFSRNGYHGTKVSDIVAEAGLSQPTFYLYFDSKESAYDALVADFRENLRQVTASNLIAPGTPNSEMQARIAVSFRKFLDFMASERSLTEIGFFQPPGCSVTKNLMVGWVASNLTQEQADLIFRNDVDAQDMARMLVGMLDQFGRIQQEEKGREALADTCARLFWCGTRP